MTKLQVAIVKALMEGLPLVEEPFRSIASEVGISQEELLAQIQTWKDDGTIRRLGSILRHHQAGYSVNAMAVWNVPKDRIDSFGAAASQMKRVSHCYQRPKLPDFDYNLYTMIHGMSREECEAVALEISKLAGISDYTLLYTTAEYKKSSPSYFTNTQT